MAGGTDGTDSHGRETVRGTGTVGGVETNEAGTNGAGTNATGAERIGVGTRELEMTEASGAERMRRGDPGARRGNVMGRSEIGMMTKDDATRNATTEIGEKAARRTRERNRTRQKGPRETSRTRPIAKRIEETGPTRPTPERTRTRPRGGTRETRPTKGTKPTGGIRAKRPRKSLGRGSEGTIADGGTSHVTTTDERLRRGLGTTTAATGTESRVGSTSVRKSASATTDVVTSEEVTECGESAVGTKVDGRTTRNDVARRTEGVTSAEGRMRANLDHHLGKTVSRLQQNPRLQTQRRRRPTRMRHLWVKRQGRRKQTQSPKPRHQLKLNPRQQKRKAVGLRNLQVNPNLPQNPSLQRRKSTGLRA
mmetsp:Transcript_16318/g.38879  ORF Transcript_16318/g.38879 Transcript_16318/m.38879 type:complete len:365 (+) Transcript_16318:1739-2833(+)